MSTQVAIDMNFSSTLQLRRKCTLLRSPSPHMCYFMHRQYRNCGHWGSDERTMLCPRAISLNIPCALEWPSTQIVGVKSPFGFCPACKRKFIVRHPALFREEFSLKRSTKKAAYVLRNYAWKQRPECRRKVWENGWLRLPRDRDLGFGRMFREV